MAFLRIPVGAQEVNPVEGHGVMLRAPMMSDYKEWVELRGASRAHLTPWEPVWPHDDLTKQGYRRRVRHYQEEARADLGYAFFVFDTQSGALAGGLTIAHVRRGVTQSATLGYWLGAPFVGRGRMTAAVRAAQPFCFDTLRLHRIDAAVQPTNVRSLAVLDRAGFQREGLARRYLKINGAWQDHVLFALLAEDWAQLETGV